MAKYNSITLVGRLTKDPISAIFGESAKVSFSIAVDRDYKKKDQENYDTDFFMCIAWNKLAEIIETYSHKGQLVLISGSVQNRSYEKDGEKKYITEIIVNKFQMLDNKKKEATNEKAQSNNVNHSEENAPF